MSKPQLTCRCGCPIERENHSVCDDCTRMIMQMVYSQHPELFGPLTSEELVAAVGRDATLTALWNLWGEPDLAAIEGRECGQPCPPDQRCEGCTRFWNQVGPTLGALLKP